MAMDSTKRERINRAIGKSYRAKRPYRRLFHALVAEYAGSGYVQNHGAVRRETVVNLLAQAADAYMMSLAANRPRVKTTTKHAEMRWFAKTFEVATNNLIKEIQLEHVLQRAVLDAFFCLGVIKIHTADSTRVQLEDGLWIDPGKPFASNVAIDNFVFDMTATEWHQVQYAGDLYRVPLDDLRDNEAFDQSVVADLTPTGQKTTKQQRTEDLSRREELADGELLPMVDLFDLWIPREEAIYTFAVELTEDDLSIKSDALAVIPWDGPEFGPYKVLSFGDVPENILPSSPAQHLLTLHRLANNLIRKQKRQAQRQKDVTLYGSSAADDMRRAKNADDGDAINVDDPAQINVMKFGGVDPGNAQFSVGVMGLFDRMAGNLSAMAGLGPSAGTARQEQLIHGAVSKKEASMQYKTLRFATETIRDLGFLMWHDVYYQMSGEYSIPGTTYNLPLYWTPDMREGDFFDYNIEIDVYSMAYQTPSQRVEALNMLMQGVYAPFMQMLMMQGGNINMQRLTDIYSDLLDLPRLKEVVEFNTAPIGLEPGPQGLGELDQGMPANTTREYVRHNVPTGGTEQNRQHVQQQAWADLAGGAGQNNTQQQAMAMAMPGV